MLVVVLKSEVNTKNDSDLPPQSSPMKRIAVVGAGPAGLAAAKALVLESAQFLVDVYERRESIGGVWNFYSDKSKVEPPIPSTDPNGEEIVKVGARPGHRFFSSMYENLETNLTDSLMEYSQVPFEPQTNQYISRTQVLEYLHKYQNTIPDSVKFNLETNVLDINKQDVDSNWRVLTENISTNSKTTQEYDAVVIANGHYELPYIPDTPGLKDWYKTDPDSVSHSKYFTSSADYRNQTVLIIGNWASGMDLAIQIGTTAKRVFVSTKDDTLKESEYDYVEKARLVTEYDVHSRTAHTLDGHTIANIDKIVFCTGYLYTMPFLRNYWPNATDGTSVKDLYKQIFYVKDPTLSFVGLTKFSSPLPISESQAAVVARVISGRMSLPSSEDMRASYELEYEAKGGKDFHSLKSCDFAYANELYSWMAESGSDKGGLIPVVWDEEKIRQREGIASVKEKRTVVIAKHADELRAKGLEFSFPAL